MPLRLVTALACLCLCCAAAGSAAPPPASFLLPHGRTLVVRHDLVVAAPGSIRIEGRIEVEPGAWISLAAGGRLEVAGQIVPIRDRRVELAAAGRGKKHPDRLEGHNVVISDSVVSQPEQSIVVGSSPRGSITVTASGVVRTANGDDSTDPDIRAGDAGEVIMGAGLDPSVTIKINGVVKGGDGGAGFSDKTGEVTGATVPPCGPGGERRVLRLRGGVAGDGGSVRLHAKTITIGGNVAPGNGGKGGSVSGHGASGGPEQGGVDLSASAGKGGQGGSIETPGNSVEDGIDAGRGGDGGSADVGAGNGGPNCDGGKTTVRVGDLGENGSSGRQPAQPHTGTLTLDTGGNGGGAADDKHPGGNGGSTFVTLPRDHLVHTLTIRSYGNGGFGFNGCGVAPKTHGTAGGDGGPLEITGSNLGSIDKSANGGVGGDGEPAGLGGDHGAEQGKARLISNSFADGGPGDPCSGPRNAHGATPRSSSVHTTTTGHATTTTTTPTSTEGTTGHTGATEYTCKGAQVTIFDDTNGGLVKGTGGEPTFSTGGKAYCVTYIQTYHWNDGKGAPPGKLGLERVAGSGVAAVGPLPAKASSGADNAPNVNWYVYVPQSPTAVIDGTYKCSDSGPGSWSANPGSGGRGFCLVQGVPAVKQ